MHQALKRSYRIRRPRVDDLPTLLNLEEACWAEPLRASRAEILDRSKRFPQGQCAIEMDDRIVGIIYSQRITEVEALRGITCHEVSSLHDDQGPILQLLAVNVFSEVRQYGLGDQLLRFMLRYAGHKRGITGVCAVTLCKKYDRQASMPMAEYIHKRDVQGLPLDPILRFHVFHGAIIKGLLPGYRPHDMANEGKGVLVEYDLRHREPKVLASPERPSLSPGRQEEAIIDAIRTFIRSVVGKNNTSGFSPSRPLEEMGVDSLDLCGLRMLLNQRFDSDLDPTFFFSYPTPEAIAAYFQERKTAPLHRSPPSDKPVEPAARTTRGLPTTPSFSQAPATPSPERPKDHPGSESRAFPSPSSNAIAVIGMACRFPKDANNPERFWWLLYNGVDAIDEVPDSRWDYRQYDDADPSATGVHTRHGGFLAGVDQFDASFFRMSPLEARATDPQQRILLETAWQALENAGLNPQELKGTRTGVFSGTFTHDYEILQVRQHRVNEPGSYFSTGNSASMAAGRLAYFFGFEGPAVALERSTRK